MYAYVTCRLDIGYAITTLSKFSSCPAKIHYHALKNVTRYLRRTKHWGIKFKRPTLLEDLPTFELENPSPLDSSLGTFDVDIEEYKLNCFVDAAYGNELRKRRSTTGFAITYGGGAIVYKSKTKTLTASSSTEAEFIAAFAAAKAVRYLQFVLQELGFEELGPTPIHIDNLAALKIINDNQAPTAQTRHINIRFFSI